MKQQIVCGVSTRISRVLYISAVFFSALYIASANIHAQSPVVGTEQASLVTTKGPLQTRESMPFLKEYRKVMIGASADALRDAWGKPEMEYPDGFLYKMSDSETVQIAIGPEKKITAISVTFLKGQGAPSFAEVFGEGVTPEKRENGSVYKMVRYPDASYWVAYYAGANTGSDVTLTMQKF